MPEPAIPISMEQLAADQTPDLIRLAYRILGSAEDAEEVVQAAFLEVLRQKTFAATNLAGFLRHLIVCRSLDLLRKRGRTQPLDFDPVSRNDREAESIAMGREWLARLRIALRSLSARQAEVFTLRYLSDFSNSEIAQQLKISENAVAVSLRKSRSELSHLLSKE